MKMHPNEMILFYNCEESSHKKTRSFAHSVTEHIQEYNFKDYKFSKLMWKEILDMLQMEPKEIINRADPKYQKEMAGKTFNQEGWLDILVRNPCLIKSPIAMMNGKAVLCETPKDIYLLGPIQKVNF